MTRAEVGILGSYNRHKRSPFETFYVGGDGMSGYSYNYATETIALRPDKNGSLTPYGYEGYAYTRLGVELHFRLYCNHRLLFMLWHLPKPGMLGLK